MTEPKITVIVPIYNVEAYLLKCLESLAAQNYSSYCVLLVDDGSTDRSGDLAREFSEDNDKFYYYKKSNGGLSDARNFGLQKTTTDYVTFVDSDDFVSEDYIGAFVCAFEKHDTDIVICNIQLVDENEQFVGVRDHMFSGVHTGYEIAENNISCGSIVSMVQNKAFRSRLFDNIRFPFGLYYEDRATTYKLLLSARKIGFVQGRNYFYLQRLGSISQHFNQKRFDDRIEVMSTIRAYINDSDFPIPIQTVDYCAALNINVSGLVQFSKYSDYSAEFFDIYRLTSEPFKFAVFWRMMRLRPLKCVIYTLAFISPVLVFALIKLSTKVLK